LNRTVGQIVNAHLADAIDSFSPQRYQNARYSLRLFARCCGAQTVEESSPLDLKQFISSHKTNPRRRPDTNRRPAR
jgi:hypothetical protein